MASIGAICHTYLFIKYEDIVQLEMFVFILLQQQIKYVQYNVYVAYHTRNSKSLSHCHYFV